MPIMAGCPTTVDRRLRNDADNDSAPDEVVVAGEPSMTILSRRTASSLGRPMTSKTLSNRSAQPDPLRSGPLRGATEPVTNLTSFLGRLTC